MADQSEHLSFLLARIAEDEAGAVAHAPDPLRWERECRAKRRIVEAAEKDAVEAAVEAANPVDGDDWCHGADAAYSLTLRHLAAVYSDHPDYREEWKP